MKYEDKQLLATLVVFGVVLAIFGVVVAANEHTQSMIEEKKPCSEYKHLHESMQPARCWEE